MHSIQVILAAFGPVSLENDTDFRTVRTIGDKDGIPWGIVGIDASNAYRALANKVHAGQFIRDNYTLRDVTRAIDLEILKIGRGAPPTESQFLSAVKALLPTRPKKHYQIWRHVFGVNFNRYRKLGGFVFQKTANMKKNFSKNSQITIGWEVMFGDFVVRFDIECVSEARAIELADDRFERLELLFACLIGSRSSGHFVRVLRPSSAASVSYAMKVDDQDEKVGMGLQGSEHEQIDLESKYFKDPTVPRLFKLISKPKPTSIEKRLVRAVEWIGKGTISRSPSEAIICYCTAIEALLVRDNKSIISPGIVSSLSEFCAFLLASKYVQRKQVDKLFKDVYRERSAVAHGGKVEVKLEMLDAARSMAMQLVVVLSKRAESGLVKDEQLIEYLGQAKYGS